MEKEAKKAEKEIKKMQKEIQQQLENSMIKPDVVKPNENLQQMVVPIKKKEPVKTIEVKEERAQISDPNVDYFAPVPVGIPVGQ